MNQQIKKELTFITKVKEFLQGGTKRKEKKKDIDTVAGEPIIGCKCPKNYFRNKIGGSNIKSNQHKQTIVALAVEMKYL